MQILPLWPISRALSQLAGSLMARHPAILQRLDGYQATRFLLDFTDLPLVLLVHPARAEVRALRRRQAPHADAWITGTLAAFLAMLHGVEDGDTLFFSGALQIGGDTAAVLALRNALDDAELDLSAEITAALPPLATPIRLGLPPLERLTRLSLRRPAPNSEVF